MELKAYQDWYPPKAWQQISCVEAHTGGEPLRIIFAGYPELPGNTILERRRAALDHYDTLRTALMWEPRGHADMYGCLVVPPVSENAHFGVLFLHNEGYSSMCGHGIIAITKVVLQLGLLPKTRPLTEVRIDTPAGTLRAFARIVGEEVKSVYFHNVPSYVVELDALVTVPGLGTVHYDLAFGGAFYAYVDARALGLRCRETHRHQLIEAGQALKKVITATRSIHHPYEADLGFLYGVIFMDEPRNPNHHSSNVCVFADGEVDRSPTGTGVSGRLAIHHARGEIELEQSIVIESIIGSCFSCKVAGTTRFGPYDAVIPSVEGNAFITGKTTHLIDPEDPLASGFFLH